MSNKKVLVVGASSGIGKSCAIRFAKEGWDVCLSARREELLHEIVSELPQGNHIVVPGSYEDPDTAKDISYIISSKWHNLDAFINSAGVFMGADLLNSSLEDWRKPFDIMVNGAILCSRAAAELMSDSGRIIHITSIWGERVAGAAGAYGMAKAAINQFCRSMAFELAPRNILVNAIAPGFVDTPMSMVGDINELETDWFRQNYLEGWHLPLRRAALPEEIAGVAHFLAGPDASYITGQVLAVDGGLSITF